METINSEYFLAINHVMAQSLGFYCIRLRILKYILNELILFAGAGLTAI